MTRPPRSSNLLSGFVVGFLLALGLSGCGPKDDPLRVGDDLTAEQLRARCRSQVFTTHYADDTLETGAIVRIRSREAGHQTTIAQLASGRFVARIENLSNVAHPNWALSADSGSVSCWRILARNGGLVAEYIGDTTVRDTTLVIEFHSQPHDSTLARFVRKPARDSVPPTPPPGGFSMSETGFLFLPASFRTALQFGEVEDWGWYTCVSNGCCRSMQ